MKGGEGRAAPALAIEGRAIRSVRAERAPISANVVVGILRMSDLGLTVLAAGLAFAFSNAHPTLRTEYLGAIGLGLMAAGVFWTSWGAYDHDYVFQRSLRIGRLLNGWFCAVGLLVLIAFALKVSVVYSRTWAFAWFMLTPGLLVLERLAFSFLVLYWVRTDRLADRTVIVGASEHGQRLAAHLNAQGDIRTRVVGFVDDRQERVPTHSHGHRVLGNLDHLVALIRGNMVDQVFIALPWTAEKRVLQIISHLAMTPVHIRLAPDLLGFEFTNREFASVAGLSMLRVFDRPISGWAQVLKTAEDRIGGGLLLLLLSPLMLLIALLIKLDSRGPVLFRQNRYGFNNDLIGVYKFRSMYTDRTDENCEVQTGQNDPRVTKIGRYLRAWSLDELPQLLNVVRGEMSLVGPRPHALSTKAAGRLFEEVVDRYAARHRVKPGITGWAQVNGWRGETDTPEKIQQRVKHDLEYIENWSIAFDLYILLVTPLALLKTDNVY